MEIKTLAEILAETPDSSKTSRKLTQSANDQKQRKRKQPRAQSSAARGFAVSKKNTPSNSDVTTDDLSDSHRIQAYHKNNYDKSKHYKKKHQRDRSQSEANKDDGDTLALTDYQSYSDTQNTNQPKRKKKKKSFHPASPYQPKKIEAAEPIKEVNSNSIKNLLAQVRSESSCFADNDALSDSSIDNLPSALKAYLKTPEQRQAEKEEIKANSRLRWLAFYYLSRREHSKGELRQKLIDKEQDPDKIDELLAEFEEKGYQSDYRTALMLIREGIRKRRGRVRIKNDFYKRKVSMPANIDELIDMAMEDNEAFVDVMSNNDLIEGVDWLQLAVEARVKKYGEDIPTEPKAKARQLRFLQYRGFKPEVCFEAISHNLETLEDRF